jgi:hypothetical protein
MGRAQGAWAGLRAHRPGVHGAWLSQCGGASFRDSVIVLYAASTDADSSDNLAVQLQRDAAWEGDQTTVVID